MGTYILRRCLIAIPVLLGITMVTFVIVNLAPGDPVTAMIDPQEMVDLGPEYVEHQKEALGLNDPVPLRYLLWTKELVQGNLGYSYVDRRPVSEKIGERLWPTVRLMGAALIVAILIAIPVGVVSALRQYSTLDYTVTILGFAAVAAPSFFLALGVIYIFSLKLGWFPSAGMNTVGQPATVGDSLRHMVLPVAVLSLAEAAPLIRYVRSSLLEVIRLDYITSARAKGLRERSVIGSHALRNSLIPLVTVVALGIPRLLAGAVIVETIFSWPGMGQLVISAVRNRDYPVVMAINLILATLILASNLAADIVYAIIDPRIRYT